MEIKVSILSSSRSSTLFKNMGMLTSSLGLGMILGMLLRLYIPRMLGVEVVGQYYYVHSIAALVTTLFGLGITNYIYKFVPLDHSLSESHFSTIMNSQIILGALILGSVAFYFSWIDSVYLLPIIFLVMNQLSNKFFNDILKPFLISMNKVKYTSLCDLSIKVLQLFVVVIVLYFFPNLTALCLSYCLVWTLGVIMTLMGSRNDLSVDRSLDWDKLKEILIYCSPFIVSNIMHTAYQDIDITIMGNIANKVEVSYYGAVLTLKGILCFALPIIIQSLSPYLSGVMKDSEEGFYEKSRDLSRYILGLVLCIGLSFVFFGKEILYILFGRDILM